MSDEDVRKEDVRKEDAEDRSSGQDKISEQESFQEFPSVVDTSKAFNSLTKYLLHEIEGSKIDYSLLRSLNNNAADHYMSLADKSQQLIKNVKTLNDKRRMVQESLVKVDELCDHINNLHTVLNDLDNYTKSLQKRVRKLKQ